MINFYRITALPLLVALIFAGDSKLPSDVRDLVWHHRNLGKAYYENQMTQLKAVDEFREALELSHNATRDRVNYGLSLLRAGMLKEAIAALMEAQKEDPSIPHTWFNLGMAYKKEFEYEHSIEQFEGMLKLVPHEPVTHYNLGVEYKLTGKADLALSQFVAASQLDPNFAAPHFQLYNAYRELGRKDEASHELESFNEIKKRKAGAAVPEDPEWSYYSEIYDKVEMDEEFDHEGSTPPFKFSTKQVAAGVDAKTAGLAVLDFDGDGRPDLLVWSKNSAFVLKNGSLLVNNSGLENLKDIVSITPGDFNNDGLTDLAVITTTGTELYVNRSGRFEIYPSKMPSGSFRKAIWLDYDHDYDLDLILLGDKSVLLRNEGAAGFSDQSIHFPFAAGRATDGTVFDLFPDRGETDLVVVYDYGATVIYRDKLLGRYEALPLPSQNVTTSSIQAFDINNDGWTDLVLGTESGVHLLINDHGTLTSAEGPKSSGAPVLADLANRSLADLIVGDSIYRNLGAGKFEKIGAKLSSHTDTIAQADFYADGRPDLAVVTREGNVELLRNETDTKNNSIGVRLDGVKNPKLAQGSVVELKTGAWYQKRIYQGVPLLFGMRSYREADTLRITWPNGLIQNEIKQSAGKATSYKEKARLSGSCPMIFAWNGSVFTFVTDVLGVAPLGASNGDGKYFPVNPREYVRIPPASLQARDGKYEIRVTEELHEISYLDQILLLAIDHKAGVEVFTNDKFKAPPFPPFRLYGVEHEIYPLSANDEAGDNMLASVRQHDDGRYAAGFHCGAAGVAPTHELTLDFGTAASDGRALLILNGWVDWADGSTFAAAAQESTNGLVFPYLQVKDSAGNWQTVIADMGMPSGKPKSIVVDLTGKFLSRSRQVKIVTNLCIYWDEIFLSEKTSSPATTITTLKSDSADLHYRGFSIPVLDPQRVTPEHFDYRQWSPTTMWNPTPGRYTRYGDVTSLITHTDDQMVIMGSGDELRLQFLSDRLPPLLAGWERSFLLMVDGWAKDADANTAYSRTVEPLPFHGMASYPYPTSQTYPADARHRAYRKQFNTRSASSDLDSLRPSQ